MRAEPTCAGGLGDRAAGSPEMVATAAMVQGLEDNKRGAYTQDRRAVTAVTLMAAEEPDMQVEVFDGGARIQGPPIVRTPVLVHGSQI